MVIYYHVFQEFTFRNSQQTEVLQIEVNIAVSDYHIYSRIRVGWKWNLSQFFPKSHRFRLFRLLSDVTEICVEVVRGAPGSAAHVGVRVLGQSRGRTRFGRDTRFLLSAWSTWKTRKKTERSSDPTDSHYKVENAWREKVRIMLSREGRKRLRS